jgi:hypothetical protein
MAYHSRSEADVRSYLVRKLGCGTIEIRGDAASAERSDILDDDLRRISLRWLNSK